MPADSFPKLGFYCISRVQLLLLTQMAIFVYLVVVFSILLFKSYSFIAWVGLFNLLIGKRQKVMVTGRTFGEPN